MSDSQLLAGKRILVTGVLNRHSIAYSIAERAQNEGATVVLTGFGRTRRMTERAAKGLPEQPDVIELDVNSDDDLAGLAAAVGDSEPLDGVVHAIAFAPEDALGGNFMGAPRASALQAFETSAYSLKGLAEAVRPTLREGGERPGASIVGLDFDASVAWPAYDWMGVAKAGLESTARYLARDLGPAGIRMNLVAAGPISTPAAGGIAGFGELAEHWKMAAPLGWDPGDATAVADTALFLLSDLARAISGEILHADGGAHAVRPVLS